MNLISSEMGQALQLFVMDETRPLSGGMFTPDIATRVIQRYRFLSAPSANQLGPNQPLKFQSGAIEIEGETYLVGSLEIYNDGIIINSVNTDDADKIMNDFIPWAINEVRLREPVTQIPRAYQSQVIVALDQSLNDFVSQFDRIKAITERAFNAEQNSLNVVRLSIGPQPPGAVPYRTTWQIERRITSPFVADRYFSTAPLPTAAHVEMLTAIEEAIAARAT
jgi:hypothetical protein